MKKFTNIILLIFCVQHMLSAQATTSATESQTLTKAKLWTEADRRYTADNFRRTRDALLKETDGLTTKQWNFREAPDRWTIGEIVEHLGILERAWSREIDIDTRNKPQPELNEKSRPDSYYAEYIMEKKNMTP